MRGTTVEFVLRDNLNFMQWTKSGCECLGYQPLQYLLRMLVRRNVNRDRNTTIIITIL